MYILNQLIYAFLSAIGFSIIFHIPKDSVIKSGLAGALGWVVFLITKTNLSSPVAGAFWGAITVGILGELFARFFKKPATVFIIPGIVPLVPGAGMYYTMSAITESRFIDAANIGSETLFVAASIASGILVSSSISRMIKRNFKIKKNIEKTA
ncbi:threonine/serine exporter family protein [Caldisalinibacter kiritimatiensis]|uniref:Membrane spanning protein n=1 Tax=Caldisalinibacter kiritimatiensis TaxID=1304284 RepID=R1AVG3_9FIRM|nr:threonine/serine exporter family protein [Caldisalinibacter kiritimatiensis]EOD00647.1 Membrane spanning protein [Caldisalinibacter kiritimatiensis]